jgi:hypothetical protein
MDALPLEEKTGLAYASKVRAKIDGGQEVGVMHACGHDIHVTTLIGTAQVLAQSKDRWRGTVMLGGQPAEETIDGAKAMLADGLYERIARNAALAALAPLPPVARNHHPHRCEGHERGGDGPAATLKTGAAGGDRDRRRRGNRARARHRSLPPRECRHQASARAAADPPETRRAARLQARPFASTPAPRSGMPPA